MADFSSVRHPDDDSQGGDLAIYRWKDGRRRTPWTVKADQNDVEQVGLVKYAPDTFMVMLSAYHPLHGVTARLDASSAPPCHLLGRGRSVQFRPRRLAKML